MKAKPKKLDPDTQATWRALKRAAKKARKLAETMGTPFYVVQSGKIIDLNPRPKRRRKSA